MSKAVTFLIMLAFWAVLSGKFDPFHFGLGILCCTVLALVHHRHLFPEGLRWGSLRRFVGLLGYMGWLIKEIFFASAQISYLVLHPRMLELISPSLIRFRTRLQRPLSRVLFAQSITLTPGTITVAVIEDEFTVYALTEAAAQSLPGEMERRVARALEPGGGA